MGLTPKQLKVLKFITDSTRKNGVSPTHAEIAQAFGLSSLGSVRNYLIRLEREGVLVRPSHQKRALQVLAKGSANKNLKTSSDRISISTGGSNGGPGALIELALLGKVAAGQPIEAVSDGTQTVSVSPDLWPKGARASHHYALQVVGDSMIEDGILEGDTLIIRSQNSAHNGQTVIALLEGAATVKRFYRAKNGVELHPANERLKPMIVRADRAFEIQGIVVGLMRRYAGGA